MPRPSTTQGKGIGAESWWQKEICWTNLFSTTYSQNLSRLEHSLGRFSAIVWYRRGIPWVDSEAVCIPWWIGSMVHPLPPRVSSDESSNEKVNKASEAPMKRPAKRTPKTKAGDDEETDTEHAPLAGGTGDEDDDNASGGGEDSRNPQKTKKRPASASSTTTSRKKPAARSKTGKKEAEDHFKSCFTNKLQPAFIWTNSTRIRTPWQMMSRFNLRLTDCRLPTQSHLA